MKKASLLPIGVTLLTLSALVLARSKDEPKPQPQPPIPPIPPVPPNPQPNPQPGPLPPVPPVPPIPPLPPLGGVDNRPAPGVLPADLAARYALLTNPNFTPTLAQVDALLAALETFQGFDAQKLQLRKMRRALA